MRAGFAAASFNQSPDLGDVDLFKLDRPLVEAARRYGADESELSTCGRDYGSAQTLEFGRQANAYPPRLHAMTSKGERCDRVEFHPAYHAMMAKSIGYGVHVRDPADPCPAVTRAIKMMLAAQAEAGHICPLTMTYASQSALAAQPDVLAQWRAKITARHYDPAFKPWSEKIGVTIGMGMTERQGGTDVRANISQARDCGDHVLIDGHKWFMSAPMCDAFLVLAQTHSGPTCYLMPRFHPNGSVNALRFARLKEKLGNASNASSEVEFCDAYAQRIGPEGQGVRTIIEMVQDTRVDCALGSLALMRISLTQAQHHIRHRSVFQRRLADQPAMRAVIADLALELEALYALTFQLVDARERVQDENARQWARLLTPAIKYHVCKRAPGFVHEALECLGGNGYSEQLPLARYFREAPLNAIWEGSGNVMALDVLRAANRQPEATRRILTDLLQKAESAGVAPSMVRELEQILFSSQAERRARYLCEGLATLAAVAALVEIQSPFAEVYAGARLHRGFATQYGACDLSPAQEQILMDRALAA